MSEIPPPSAHPADKEKFYRREAAIAELVRAAAALASHPVVAREALGEPSLTVRRQHLSDALTDLDVASVGRAAATADKGSALLARVMEWLNPRTPMTKEQVYEALVSAYQRPPTEPPLTLPSRPTDEDVARLIERVEQAISAHEYRESFRLRGGAYPELAESVWDELKEALRPWREAGQP